MTTFSHRENDLLLKQQHDKKSERDVRWGMQSCLLGRCVGARFGWPVAMARLVGGGERGYEESEMRSSLLILDSKATSRGRSDSFYLESIQLTMWRFMKHS